MARRLAAEFVGTALLLAAIVGSGIAGERFADTVGLTLLINAFATGAALVAIILALGPVSGAHINPAVTLADAWLGGLTWREAVGYCGAQVAGAFAGVAVANSIYGEAAFAVSDKARFGGELIGSEAVATFGLLLVILGCVRAARPGTTAFAVGAYIAAAFFFTSSTAFANPAVSLGRVVTDTFTGIRVGDALTFVPAQLVGAFAATALMRWLYPSLPDSADEVVVAHAD